MKKSIAIDMDETVADTLSRHIQWYQQKYNIILKREDMQGARIYDVIANEHLTTVKNFPHDPDFFRDLAVFENAIEVIGELNSRYDIYFASSAMEYPSSFTAKYDWLKQHFPFISDMNYIFCGYKGMLNCDYLIDDSPRHIDAFSGQGLLFDAPHNKNEQGYNRVCSWQQVAQMLG